MKTRKTTTKASDREELLKTSSDIYGFLINHAGFDEKYYDIQLIEDICKILKIDSTRKMKSELKNRPVSVESLIGAFLRGIQPYSKMLEQLYALFEKYGISKTNENMKIRFDFDAKIEEIDIDLDQFRQTLVAYRKALQKTTIYGWNLKTLWKLELIFRPYNIEIIKDPIADSWLNSYHKGSFDAQIPVLPTTGSPVIDEWLERVWHVWVSIISEYLLHGKNRNQLMRLRDIAESKKEDSQVGALPNIVIEEEGLFRDWDITSLWFLESDYWAGSFLQGFWGFVEMILNAPSKANIFDSIQAELTDLFHDLPKNEIERDSLVRDFLDILNLPIWKQRHELYQVWVLSQIMIGVQKYSPTIFHDQGSLILKFSGTLVGTFNSQKGNIELWSELRSPYDKPTGKSRKDSIQPDYSLTFQPKSDTEKKLLIIECKQYRKANNRNFADAINDYANACPNATVLLVNYAAISASLNKLINTKIKQRVHYIGDFRPTKSENLNKFMEIISKALPKPKNPYLSGYKTIVIDISDSMRGYLKSDNFHMIVKSIIENSSRSRLIAVDTIVKKEYIDPLEGLEDIILHPNIGGFTNIPQAIQNYDKNNMVIVTDSDGLAQASEYYLKDDYRILLIEFRADGPRVYYQLRRLDSKEEVNWLS